MVRSTTLKRSSHACASLSKVIGKSKVYDLDDEGFEKLGQRICTEIGTVVDARLPSGSSAYANLVSWIIGASRDHPVEIFTTNYDLLLEEAFEAVRAPSFDGFVGGREPFFDPVSIANNDLPTSLDPDMETPWLSRLVHGRARRSYSIWQKQR